MTENIKKEIMEKIVPMYNAVVTTADRYTEEECKSESGLYLLDQMEGQIKLKQTIISVGSTACKDLKVGDTVMINPKQYIRKEQKPKAFQPDPNKQVYETSFYVEWPVEESEGREVLFIYDSDVKYIIEEV